MMLHRALVHIQRLLWGRIIRCMPACLKTNRNAATTTHSLAHSVAKCIRRKMIYKSMRACVTGIICFPTYFSFLLSIINETYFSKLSGSNTLGSSMNSYEQTASPLNGGGYGKSGNAAVAVVSGVGGSYEQSASPLGGYQSATTSRYEGPSSPLSSMYLYFEI